MWVVFTSDAPYRRKYHAEIERGLYPYHVAGTIKVESIVAVQHMNAPDVPYGFCHALSSRLIKIGIEVST